MALLMRQPMPARDGTARQVLAKAIEAHRTAQAAYRATVAAAEKADMEKLEARGRADVAAAAVAQAPEDVANHPQALPQGTAGTPPATAREYRDQVLDAADALLAARSARDVLQRRISADADRMAWAEQSCRTAALDVLRGEISPAVADMLGELGHAQQTVARIGRVIESLVVAGAIAADAPAKQAVLRHTTPPSGWGFQGAGALDPAAGWRAALARLQTDPEAPAVIASTCPAWKLTHPAASAATEGAVKMKSFEEFADRVDDLLTQVAGPAAGMEMLKQAKSEGMFNDYHDDRSRWTEEQARDVAEHIIRQTEQDAEFVKTAVARLAIP